VHVSRVGCKVRSEVARSSSRRSSGVVERISPPVDGLRLRPDAAVGVALLLASCEAE